MSEPYNPVKAMAALIAALRETDLDDGGAVTDVLLDAFTERTRALLRKLVPERMADDLADEGAHEIDFLAEQLTTYLTADETSRAEMAAFHEDCGLDMIRTAALTVEANMAANDPTPEDLRRAFDAAPPAPAAEAESGEGDRS